VIAAYRGQTNIEIFLKCVSQHRIFHSFQSHHKHYGWFVLPKVFTRDERYVYL